MSNSEVKTESNALSVHTFTRDTGNPCPDKPQPMSRDSVMFITRMIMSELDELVCTVTGSSEERDQFLQEALSTRDPCKNIGHKHYPTEDDLIAGQFDALVDAWYYSLNVAAKHGVNMSAIFDLVHGANMAKRDPVTGTFLKRESDGKIIKPAGWTSPDITAEVARQKRDGAWNSF